MTVAADPLRETFLEQVRDDCAAALEDADRRAAAIVAETDERGRALVAQARADGVAAAALVGSQEHAAARRRSRARVLAARRELYDELQRRTVEEASALREAPGYASLLERLAAAARGQLGEDAQLELDPAGPGGVRATAGARSVDYTLPALAERCLGRLGARVEELWR